MAGNLPFASRRRWLRLFHGLEQRLVTLRTQLELQTLRDDIQEAAAVLQDDMLEHGFTEKEVVTAKGMSGFFEMLDEVVNSNDRSDRLAHAEFFFTQLSRIIRGKLGPTEWDPIPPLTETPTYYEAEQLVKRWPEEFEIVRYFSGDDILSRSNRRVWNDNHSEGEGKRWWWLDYDRMLVRTKKLADDERESLDSLENYPVLDDNDYSELEQEEQNEQWDDFGRRDFIRKMIKHAQKVSEANGDAVESLIEAWGADFDRIFWEACSNTERYPEMSGDELVVPDPSKVFAHVTRPPGSMWHREDWDGTITGLLTNLGEITSVEVTLSDRAFCRIHPDDIGGVAKVDLRRYGQALMLTVSAAALPSEIADALLQPFKTQTPSEKPRVVIELSAFSNPLAVFTNEFLEVELSLIVEAHQRRYYGYRTDPDDIAAREARYAELRGQLVDVLTRELSMTPPADLTQDVFFESVGGHDALEADLFSPDADERRRAREAFMKDAVSLAKRKLAALAQIPYCNVRQVALPGVSEAKRRRR